MNINDFVFQEKYKTCLFTGESLEDSFVSKKQESVNFAIPGFLYSYSPSIDHYFLNPVPKPKELLAYYNSHNSPLTPDVIDRQHADFHGRGNSYRFKRWDSSHNQT
ncbi:MAG: hypothetical protein HW380_3928 [Magnetococcales bacterium]|nr:hypothetical protein [Magnetococcales bacterium]